MCFTHVKYRGSGCKPRGLEDITIRRDVNKPFSHLCDSCLSTKLLTLGIAHASMALHSLNRNSPLRLGCQLTPSRCADFPYLANARRGRKRDLAMGFFIDKRTEDTKEIPSNNMLLMFLCLNKLPFYRVCGHNTIVSLRKRISHTPQPVLRTYFYLAMVTTRMVTFSPHVFYARKI